MNIVKISIWICYPFVTGLSTVIYCFLEMYKLYKLVWAGCDISHTIKEINQSIIYAKYTKFGNHGKIFIYSVA